MTVTPVPPPAGPSVYVVGRGDTLWGIAERELGDPLAWSQIYQLNVGRPQPGGASLTDPHWIDPGWTLLLPARSSEPAPVPTPPPASPQAAPSTPAPSPTSSPPPSGVPPSSTSPSTPSDSTPIPSSTATPQPPTATSPDRSQASPHDAPRPGGGGGEPVRLPSGSVVAASFAAGVAATVAAGRLRRRHAYRYRPPEPGRTRATEPVRATLAHLRRAITDSETGPDEPGTVPAMAVPDEERRGDPGRLDVGSSHGETVRVELTELNGVALVGAAADDVARALAAALLTRAGPGAAEVLCTEDTAGRLFPGLTAFTALRRLASPDLVARAVESERIARTRRLDAVGAADAAQFRAENPEHPLPLLFVLLDDLPDASLGRWQALVSGAAHLSVAVVFLAPTPLATGTLDLDATGRVQDAAPADVLGALGGVELFVLRADEAVEVLGALGDAARQSDLDDEAAGGVADGATDRLVLDEPGEEPWPEPAPADLPDDLGPRPVCVRVLGHLEVTVRGEAVVTGLRSRARDLLAWFMLRPEGATSDEAVDVLWPDTAPGRVHGQFWRSFSDLRARLREAAGVDLDVLMKAGEHYRPARSEIVCDLWELQAALAEASRTDDQDQARLALRRAVGCWRGDLLVGVDRPWIEPVRQDLHRRALDAHLRLAELEEQAGRSDAAVEVLEQAIEGDRYAEEPYRRLMVLHASHDHRHAVRAVWQLLQGRLGELDLDVESATASLYRQLTAPTPPGLVPPGLVPPGPVPPSPVPPSTVSPSPGAPSTVAPGAAPMRTGR